MSQAIGFSQVFTAGDIVLENPVESCFIFIFVIILTASLEYFLQICNHVDNKYFHIIFQAFSEEVMIVAVLALLLDFMGSTIAEVTNERFYTYFKWAHMCLFFMAVMFSGVIAGLIFAVQFRTKDWKVFEETRQNTDPRLTKNEFRYKQACEHFKASLKYIGQNKSEAFRFADYISKMQRYIIVQVCDLSWTCWIGLCLIVVVNTGRGYLVRPTIATPSGFKVSSMSRNELILSFGSFILICGYTTLAFFLVADMILQKRLSHYLESKLPDPRQRRGDQGRNSADLLEQLPSPEIMLFRGSRGRTLTLLQIIIMLFEWYTAVFLLTMIYEITNNFTDSAYFTGCSALVIIVGLAPPLIFLYCLPWTIFCVTCMSFLGSNLDVSTIRRNLPEEEKGREEEKEDEDVLDATINSLEWSAQKKRTFSALKKKDTDDAASGPLGGDGPPSFLDDDEEWNGEQIILRRSIGTEAAIPMPQAKGNRPTVPVFHHSWGDDL